MSAFKLVDGRCPDCGQPPATRGWVEEEDTRGDLCTHPCHDEEDEAPRVDWVALIASTIHPTQVLILHAVECIGEPVGPRDLVQVLDGKVHLSQLSYHFRRLGELGILEAVKEEQVRGAMAKFWVPVA